MQVLYKGGIAKSMFRRAKESNGHINLMLFIEYSSNVIIGLKLSPSQLLMSCSLKTKLPVLFNNTLKPVIKNDFIPK